MKHASSRALYAYWNRLRGERSAPERGELKPHAISSILGDVLILEVGGPERFMVRLAGTQICSLMGRELKGRSFAEPFVVADWPEIYGLLNSVVSTTTPVVVSLTGETATRRMLGLELLLLPLRHNGRTQARVLGSLAAQIKPYWATVEPLVCLRVVSSRIVRQEDTVLSDGDIAFAVGKLRAPTPLRVLPGGRL
jgi:hypothetical protein